MTVLSCSSTPRSNRPGRALFLLLMGFLAVAPVAYAADDAQTRDPREYFFAQTFGDLPDELEEAKKSGKIGLLLFYEQEGCAYCQRMMRTVLNQREVQDWYGKRFVSIAVDIRGDVEIRDVDGVTLPSKVFAAHRKVKLTPVLSFLDLNGTEIYRNIGLVKSPEEFLLIGRYIADGRYTDTTYADYRREKGAVTDSDILITPVKPD